MKFNGLLYANSDSYGVCSTGNTYVDFIGNKLKAEKIINNGLGGSCNRRIIRTTVRDLLNLKNIHNNIIAIIGFAPPNRSEYWGDAATDNDGHFKSLQPNSVVPPGATKLQQGLVETYDDESANTNLFLDIILLTTFLKANNIKYLIWQGSMSLKSSDFSAPFIENFYNEVKADPCVLDMFEFGFSKYCSIIKGYIPYDNDRYGIYGHHTEEAHKDFADYIYENYLQCKI